MLEVYARLAKCLASVQWLLLVLVAGSGAWLVYSLVSPAGDHDQTLGSACSLAWAISLVLFVQIFSRPLAELDRASGFGTRLKVRLLRAVRMTAAVAVTALFVGVLYLSSKAIGVLL